MNKPFWKSFVGKHPDDLEKAVQSIIPWAELNFDGGGYIFFDLGIRIGVNNQCVYLPTNLHVHDDGKKESLRL